MGGDRELLPASTDITDHPSSGDVIAFTA